MIYCDAYFSALQKLAAMQQYLDEIRGFDFIVRSQERLSNEKYWNIKIVIFTSTPIDTFIPSRNLW